MQRSFFSLKKQTFALNAVDPFKLYRTRSFSKTMVGGPAKDWTVAPVDKKGAFQRIPSGFRHWVSEEDAKDGLFSVESGRYHLYISHACPWANRTLAFLYLKGLEEHIGVSVVHPIFQRTRPEDPDDTHFGWAFASPEVDEVVTNPVGNGNFITPKNCTLDSINHAKYVRDLYDMAKDETKRYSVPILWDKKLKTIVNNESSDIIRMFNKSFNKLAKNPELDLYPKELQTIIDEANERMYESINNGVYRCGFAKGQQAYEEAIEQMFDQLDYFDDLLSRQRYLAGRTFTEADIRLFVTLIRFDEVYVVHFKCNKKTIHEYSNLFNYVKEIYQMPEIKRTIHFDHIKNHYYGSHNEINKFAIVPVGPGINYEEPHDRDRF